MEPNYLTAGDDIRGITGATGIGYNDDELTREELIALINVNGNNFRRVPNNLKNDEELNLLAAKKTLKSLKYMRGRFISKFSTDKELIKDSLASDGMGLEYINKKLVNDSLEYKELALIALKQNRESYRFLPKSLHDEIQNADGRDYVEKLEGLIFVEKSKCSVKSARN